MDLIPRIEQLREEAGFSFDVELFVAILAALVGKQHAIVTVGQKNYLDFVEQMILLIGSNIFGFKTRSVTCTSSTTTEEFINAMLIQSESAPGMFSPLPTPSYESSTEMPWNGLKMDATDEMRVLLQQRQREFTHRGHKFPNLLVIRDLDLSSNYVQSQILEIIRTKKLITAKGVFLTPPSFLIIPLCLKTNSKLHLFPYLLDHFCLSHYYEPADADDFECTSETLTRTPELRSDNPQELFTAKEIDLLSNHASSVVISPEIRRYMHDIIVFLRMHRATRGGISARSSRDFEILIKCLCPLHHVGYAIPTIVVIAARKVFGHRINMATAAEDRSVLYGSDPKAVGQFLQEWTPDLVLDDIFETVPAPI
ncbi:hypothetical protein V1512DRAFT_15343 [Lipomyces arxii]|uniref:uncharacterized protein n=1 Tax=Lipomyces arxii TaxID=56418 RepID=UPI0034CD1B5E